MTDFFVMRDWYDRTGCDRLRWWEMFNNASAPNIQMKKLM